MREPYEHDDDARDQAVDLYRRGTPLRKITEQTGLSQPALYYELEKRGMRPRRRAKAGAATVDAHVLLEQLLASQREIERLRIRLERAERELRER